MKKTFNSTLFRNKLESLLGPNFQSILVKNNVVLRNSLVKWISPNGLKSGPRAENQKAITDFLASRGIKINWNEFYDEENAFETQLPEFDLTKKDKDFLTLYDIAKKLSEENQILSSELQKTKAELNRLNGLLDSIREVFNVGQSTITKNHKIE